MSYSREDLRLFSRLALDLAAAGTVDDVIHRTLPVLEKLMGSEVLGVDRVPDGATISETIAVRNIDLTHPSVREFPRFAHQNPALSYWVSGGRAPVVRISDFLSERQFMQTGLYREVYGVFDGRHQMALMVPIRGETYGFMLFRNRAFTDDEAFMLGQLKPHVARALSGARDFGPSPAASGADTPGEGGEGYVCLDMALRPTLVTPRAMELLARYFPGEASGRALPGDLARWAGVTARILNEAGLTVIPARNLAVPAAHGCLEIRMVLDRFAREPRLQLREVRGGRDFTVLERIGLTKRECEVLFWVAQGKRDGEVAKVLGIATRTAGKHMENILAKLGCETRTGAVRAAEEILRASG